MIIKVVERTEQCLNSFMMIGLINNTKNIVESFLKEMMKTIPDAIDDILWYIKRVRDVYYRFFEHWGSKMNVYGWNGRWKNREKGTGYGKTR